MNIAIVSKEVNHKIIKYFQENFQGHKIFSISPQHNSFKENPTLTLIPDSVIYPKEDLKKQLTCDRFNWYYQQFLKYKIVDFLEGDETLIVDGDTVISKNIIKSNSVWTTGHSPFSKYVQFNELLLPNLFYDKKELCSFVTNQMIFNKNYLKALLNSIEEHSGKNWIESIVTTISKHPNAQFSEYQLYGEYVFRNNLISSINKTKVFRRMDLINREITKGLHKYSILAYEPHHKTGIIRRLRAIIFYSLGINLG